MASQEPVIADLMTMAQGHVKRCEDLYKAAITDYQVELAEIRKEKEGLERDLGAKDDELAAALKEEEEAGAEGEQLSPDKTIHDSQGDNVRRRTIHNVTREAAAKLKTDFISYGLNSDISPENWNPDEVKKYQSVEGKTTWGKFRMAVTQERKKNASLETDLRKAKAREAKTKKEVKQEKAKSRNSNRVIDNLRERNDKMRLLLTMEANMEANMADEVETE